jgi:hypothetical protein
MVLSFSLGLFVSAAQSILSWGCIEYSLSAVC